MCASFFFCSYLILVFSLAPCRPAGQCPSDDHQLLKEVTSRTSAVQVHQEGRYTCVMVGIYLESGDGRDFLPLRLIPLPRISKKYESIRTGPLLKNHQFIIQYYVCRYCLIFCSLSLLFNFLYSTEHSLATSPQSSVCSLTILEDA